MLLKLWRPFLSLSREVGGGNVSFREHPRLFSAQGGESSSKTGGIIDLLVNTSGSCASLEPSAHPLGVLLLSERPKPWVWTKQLLAAASPGVTLVALAGFCSHLAPGTAQQQHRRRWSTLNSFPRGFLSSQPCFEGLCFPSTGMDGPPKPQSQLRSRIYWASSPSTGGGRKPMETGG